MSLTDQALIDFLRDDLGVDTTGVTPQTPLFSSGLIDSFSLVTLLGHIEQACGFRVGPTDVNLDNFDSIERMQAYIASMVGSGR